MYIYITESLCYTPEINVTVLINYTPIKKKNWVTERSEFTGLSPTDPLRPWGLARATELQTPVMGAGTNLPWSPEVAVGAETSH